MTSTSPSVIKFISVPEDELIRLETRANEAERDVRTLTQRCELREQRIALLEGRLSVSPRPQWCWRAMTGKSPCVAPSVAQRPEK